MSPNQDEVYLLRNRNKAETDRLNFQHNVLKRIMGNRIVHPQVPLEKLQSVADIATGTAIWLQELREYYATIPSSSNGKRYLHGFDISDAQYPSDLTGITLSLHDVTQPFDQQFHNRFDFVHVRLLALALTPAQIKQAVANIIPIVAPGGYIQWDDLIVGEVGFNVPVKDLEDDIKIVRDFLQSIGLSSRIPYLIQELFDEAGLCDIVHDKYSVLSESEVTETAHKWYRNTIKPSLMEVLKRKGHSEDELAQKGQEFDNRTDAAFRDGVLPIFPFGCVVARKPVQE